VTNHQLKAIGLTCGIGSLLVGAKQAGFKVVGNIEWRTYYGKPDTQGRTTFGENFGGALFKNRISHLSPQEIERCMELDLAMGHPECGNYSQLNTTNGQRPG